MSLGRPAKGLPRYYMDVGWYRAPRFVGLPVDALFVFEACVGYCNEHATDGRVPAHPEDLAAVLGLRASIVRKAIRPLIERQALLEYEDQLILRDWAEHNPTAAEVEQHTQIKSGAGSYGNHVRWHVQRGLVDPDCTWCQSPNGTGHDPPPDIAPDRTCDPPSDADSDRTTVANPSLGMGWDGIGTEDLSSSDELTRGPDPPDDDDPTSAAGAPPDQPERVGAALAVLADRDLDARQTAPGQPPVGDPLTWRNRAYDQRSQRHAGTLTDLARQHPDASPEQLADLAAPPPAHQPRTTRDPYDDPDWRTAQRQAHEAGMAKARQIAAEPPPPDAAERLRAIRQHTLPGRPGAPA